MEPEHYTDVQKQYRAAWGPFLERVTVGLNAGSVEGQFSGSGTVLSTPMGIPFILTAKHVVMEDGWQPLDVIIPPGARDAAAPAELVHDAGADVLVPPNPPGRSDRDDNYLDVAVVTIRPAARERLRAIAEPVSVVADDEQIVDADPVVLTGYPRFLWSGEQQPAERKWFIGNIAFVTKVEGKDPLGRFRVNWNDAEAYTDAPWLPHVPKVEAHRPFELGDAHGISGGGLWRLRGAPSNRLWSMSSTAKVLGVASAYLRGIEFCEAASAWAPWLRGVVERLDSDG